MADKKACSGKQKMAMKGKMAGKKMMGKKMNFSKLAAEK